MISLVSLPLIFLKMRRLLKIIKPDVVQTWMSHADLFVLALIREGFGNVIVEAMACDTQVVSTDCPSGPYEILEGGKWGELVPPSNPNLLAQAIINSLDNPLKIDVKTRVEFLMR